MVWFDTQELSNFLFIFLKSLHQWSDCECDLKDAILLKIPNTFVGVDVYQLKVWNWFVPLTFQNLNQVLKSRQAFYVVNQRSYDPIGQSLAAQHRFIESHH